jgi:hypothetical protein
MGAWGAGLFEDDDAADLREDYRTFLADAQTDEGASDLAARNYGASFENLADTTGFWLALALVEHRAGRLDPRVKAAALSIIDGDLDLAKWASSALQKKRARVLLKLRHTLMSPAPPAKPLPKPIPTQLPGWEFSGVVGYRLENGKYAVLHMMNYRVWSNVRARAPIVSVLNWFSEGVPRERDIAGLTYLNHSGYVPSSGHLLNLAMPARNALRDEQFDHLGVTKPVTRSEAASSVHGIGGEEGRSLDQALTQRLWPYWEDPTRPVHLDKPPAGASRAEGHAFYGAQRTRLFGSAL